MAAPPPAPLLAFDIGATAVRVADAAGVRFDEPNLLGNRADGSVVVGYDAAAAGRAQGHDVELIEPLGGESVAWASLERLLRGVLRRSRAPSSFRAVVAAPALSDETVNRALSATLLAVGATAVDVVPAPVVAALGAGMPALDPTASMVIHAGARSTSFAIVSWGGVVQQRELTVGGHSLRDAVRRSLRRDHRLLTPPGSLEQLQTTLCMLQPSVERVQVVGYDIPTGQTRTCDVSAEELAGDTRAVWDQIASDGASFMASVGATVAGDLIYGGAMLTGGLACARGLDGHLGASLGIPTFAADAPRAAPMAGLIALIRDPAALAQVRRLAAPVDA